MDFIAVHCRLLVLLLLPFPSMRPLRTAAARHHCIWLLAVLCLLCPALACVTLVPNGDQAIANSLFAAANATAASTPHRYKDGNYSCCPVPFRRVVVGKHQPNPRYRFHEQCGYQFRVQLSLPFCSLLAERLVAGESALSRSDLLTFAAAIGWFRLIEAATGSTRGGTGAVQRNAA